VQLLWPFERESIRPSAKADPSDQIRFARKLPWRTAYCVARNATIFHSLASSASANAGEVNSRRRRTMD